MKDRFLDVGTGTGILAIAAVKLGFRSVWGVDTDTLAIEAAAVNARENDAASVVLRLGDLTAAEGTFNMIAANLISGTLVDCAAGLAELLAVGGYAVCSGILKGQEVEVIDAAKRAGLVLCESLQDGKWMSLVFGKD